MSSSMIGIYQQRHYYMSIVATWLGSVPSYIASIEYPLPLRGYVPMDVYILAVAIANGTQGTSSTQGRQAIPTLSRSKSETPQVSSQHPARSSELHRVVREMILRLQWGLFIQVRVVEIPMVRVVVRVALMREPQQVDVISFYVQTLM